METLTREIADEYRKRAMLLPANGLQDIGKRRELRKELQARCDLTELQAVNIINGFHKEWNPAELDGHSEGRRAGRVHCNHRSQKMRGSKAGRSGRGTLQNCGGNDS